MGFSIRDTQGYDPYKLPHETDKKGSIPKNHKLKVSNYKELIKGFRALLHAQAKIQSITIDHDMTRVSYKLSGSTNETFIIQCKRLT